MAKPKDLQRWSVLFQYPLRPVYRSYLTGSQQMSPVIDGANKVIMSRSKCVTSCHVQIPLGYLVFISSKNSTVLDLSCDKLLKGTTVLPFPTCLPGDCQMYAHPKSATSTRLKSDLKTKPTSIWRYQEGRKQHNQKWFLYLEWDSIIDHSNTNTIIHKINEEDEKKTANPLFCRAA